MSRAMNRLVLAAAAVCLTAAAPMAQQTSTTTATKTFEVLAVDGNQLIARLPEGTREITVPDDFRFTVNGQQMSVQELKVGMKGTATITTRTTVTPVTVTEVKNGTVMQRSGSSVLVRTEQGFKNFTQGDVDKRGIKIIRDGKPLQLADLREGDRLSATIVTTLPPKVVTEKEVNATLAAAAKTGAGAGGAGTGTGAAAAPAASGTKAAPAAAASTGSATRTLPKTASSWPLVGLASALLLAMGFALTMRRRFAR